MMIAFLLCQVYVVAFIALHDWLPLGNLNNLAGIRAVDTRTQLMRTTAVSTLPFAVGLAGSAYYSTSYFPMWLLWITYGAGLYGILRAWYLPYLICNDPDTLHVTFHAVLVALVVLLFLLTFSGRLTGR